jgi:hypothetical protein
MSELAAVKSEFVERARAIYGIAHRRMNRKYKIAAIAEYLQTVESCPDCIEAEKHANSDATTPGFFYRKCSKHRVHLGGDDAGRKEDRSTVDVG